MQSLRVTKCERLTREDESFWANALADRDFGEFTVAWTEAIRSAGPQNLEITYLQVYSGEKPLALVVLHVLRRLDLAAYMGPTIKSIFSPLARLGIVPLAMDLAFVEVPIRNTSGLRFAPGGEIHADEIARTLLSYVRKNFRYRILAFKAWPERPGEDAYDRLGLVKTNFLAHMSLNLSAVKSYEQYLMSLNQRDRRECRHYARIFREAGGTIAIMESADDRLLETMSRLSATTLDHHARNSDLQVPIPLGPGFFRALIESLPGRARVILASIHGEPVAFMMVLSGSQYSYATHCGLNYEKTKPSRAYFNLFYAAIEAAIQRGDRSLELGTEAYMVKKKLGAEPQPTRYYFEVRNRLVRGIMSLVARNFESQDGSRL
jgi:predicted N-acyltransferase